MICNKSKESDVNKCKTQWKYIVAVDIVVYKA